MRREVSIPDGETNRIVGRSGHETPPHTMTYMVSVKNGNAAAIMLRRNDCPARAEDAYIPYASAR
jgi:hypothetical protein